MDPGRSRVPPEMAEARRPNRNVLLEIAALALFLPGLLLLLLAVNTAATIYVMKALGEQPEIPLGPPEIAVSLLSALLPAITLLLIGPVLRFFLVQD